MNDFTIDQDRNLYRDRLYSRAINDEEASLTHYGVLGMKWGVRKAKDTGGNGKRKGKKSKNSTKSKAEKTKSALKTAGKIALGVAGVAGATLAGAAIYDHRDDIMSMASSSLNDLIGGFKTGQHGGGYSDGAVEAIGVGSGKVARGVSKAAGAVGGAVGSAAKSAGTIINRTINGGTYQKAISDRIARADASSPNLHSPVKAFDLHGLPR